MSLRRALQTGDLAELPGRRDEDWRWSDLRGLIREIPRSAPAITWTASGPFGGLGEREILMVNGSAPVAISIGEGRTEAVRLRFVAAAEQAAHVASVAITVAKGGRLTLLESHEGEADGYVADAELDIVVEEGGAAERIVIAADRHDAIRVVEARVALRASSVYSQTVLASGAKRQRLETHVQHGAPSSALRLDGAYLLGDRRHSDQTTVVEHHAVGAVTSELVKGAASGQARGVFQGRIVVEPGADQTDARLGHHALILSDRAEVDAKPELLIHADDVACAHGNTVGALDEDALFYARQRGIPETEARAMLTEAFVGEVVDRIEHEGARDVARAWVAETLRGL